MGERMYGELALFSGRANPELAQEIADYLGVPLREADVFEFPNGNTYVRLHKSVRSHDVFLIQTVCSPVNQNLMELLIFIDTLRRDSAGRITAVTPYLAYARSDKKHEPRVPIAARLVADLISAAGADRWMTIDLHAGQIQGFFSIPGDELTAFHLLSDYFLKKELDDAVIVTGDLGFAKKGRNFAAKLGLPMAFVEKRRGGDGSETEALTVIGEVKGKDVIVVDDEVATAGTAVQAVNIVKEHGAKDVYLSFTHPILVPPAADRLRELPIKEIVTTNTLPLPPQKRLPNMTVLSVAPLLAEVIRRVHLGLSVGEMFGE
ncbi:MAG: ribose-phosphate pyrophosphokinase [Chloroflexi bacterium]|nr:ribose-phosphate pyrophosphokinase [Chloroflexota bacterium]